MGVVYKLTDEVTQFVIEQKRDNPRLSCRALVQIINERFQTKVSKSSINAIVKDAHLSSPVGRTPRGVPGPRKFQIPKEKKTQIFPSAVPETRKTEKTPIVKPPSPAVERSAPKILPKERNKTESVDIEHDIEEQQSLSPARPIVPRGIFCDGVGAIFLKAAQWLLCERSLLGALLCEGTSKAAGRGVDEASDALMLMEIFGIKGFEHIQEYTKPGLWKINDTGEPLTIDAFRQLLQKVGDLKKLSLKFSYEIPQAFTEIHAIQLTQEDGAELTLDAELGALWPGRNVASSAVNSLHKAISLATGNFVNNVQSAVLGTADFYSEEFIGFVEACGGIPGKRIARVSLMDASWQVVTQFESFPAERRNFVVGLDIGNVHKLLQDIEMGNSQQVYSSSSDKNMAAWDISSEAVFGTGLHPVLRDVRVIALADPKKRTAGMVLGTNIPAGEQSAAQIALSYMARWPNLQQSVLWKDRYVSPLGEGEGPEPVFRKSLGHLETNLFTLVYGMPGIQDIIHSLLLALNNSAQRHFFPKNYSTVDLSVMTENFYRLSGYVWADGKAIFLQLDNSQCKPMYASDLAYAKARVNEKEIYDYLGRKIHIL